MKISYKHLIRHIESKPDLNELSQKLFQLGHEHEITTNNILDMEFTPNRGDCLSINGLLRDLKLFYEINIDEDIYEKEIKPSSMSFENNAKEFCSNISFLKVEIDAIPKNYNGPLADYFLDLNLKKNNFFTDISNFISYETGQPTHCYDTSKLGNSLKLDFISKDYEFETLIDKKICLNGKNMVFFGKNNEVINLAGIIGNKATACSNNTKSVTIECAYFDPEIIIGKSVKYSINSDAAHKFERNTDSTCHNFVLRRFLKIIEMHTNIKSVEIFSESYNDKNIRKIEFDHKNINKVLGTNIDKEKCTNYLTRLGFDIRNSYIQIPPYRNDINSINDISEEIARAFGYDEIVSKNFDIPEINKQKINNDEDKLKSLLVNHGFYEVINNPFTSIHTENSISIDNPLDSNRSFLRTSLKESLIESLLYNERRQQDSVKLFEITDIYSTNSRSGKRILGIIGSGRVDNNYQDFSKKIDNNYIEHILNKIKYNKKLNFQDISRKSIGSKLKNPISYLEIEIDSTLEIDASYFVNNFDINNKHYNPISEYPSSIRDISFSVKKSSDYYELEEYILNFKDNLLKEVFIFDYYNNKTVSEIKIGFRFIFQSKNNTITEKEVNEVMNIIISSATNIDSVTIPGL